MFKNAYNYAKNVAKKAAKPAAVVIASTAGAMVIVGDASATSVIDTTMKTALSSGFTDLMDTIKDVISASWQIVIGGTVLMAAPGLVQRLIHKATGK